MAPWSAEPRAAAIVAELAPYSWRDLTDRMVARLAVAATDRCRVVRLVHSVPGSAVGALEPLEPVDPDDPRVARVERELGQRRWRGLALDRLAADVVAALDGWQAERDALDPGRTLLDDR